MAMSEAFYSSLGPCTKGRKDAKRISMESSIWLPNISQDDFDVSGSAADQSDRVNLTHILHRVTRGQGVTLWSVLTMKPLDRLSKWCKYCWPDCEEDVSESHHGHIIKIKPLRPFWSWEVIGRFLRSWNSKRINHKAVALATVMVVSPNSQTLNNEACSDILSTFKLYATSDCLISACLIPLPCVDSQALCLGKNGEFSSFRILGAQNTVAWNRMSGEHKSRTLYQCGCTC